MVCDPLAAARLDEEPGWVGGARYRRQLSPVPCDCGVHTPHAGWRPWPTSQPTSQPTFPPLPRHPPRCAVPASQYNPPCQMVELTPPTTEYCRQYTAGAIEDIWTVAGKVRCGGGEEWHSTADAGPAVGPAGGRCGCGARHPPILSSCPFPPLPSLASPWTHPSRSSTRASTSGPSPRARSSSEAARLRCDLCAAVPRRLPAEPGVGGAIG